MRIVPLKQLSRVDISNVDKKIKEGEPEVVLCNFVDVYRNWAITGALVPSLMRATANQNQIDRFSLHKGQVAITKDSETRDDIGVAAYIADEIENGVLGYHCALITPDENLLLGSYLNIVLHSPYAQKYFEANASGSGQRYTLTNEIIEGFPVPLPDINTQEKLGTLCMEIDSKISNNNAICSELEEIAKLLYDYWFVQFDFPDENGKPYKSSGGKMVWNEELKREIPEGWRLSKLGKECEVLLGGTPDTTKQEYWDGDIPWLNSGEVASSPVLSAEKSITKIGMNSSATAFAKAGAVVMSITRYIRPSILGIDACFNQSVVAVKPTERLHTSYIYPLMKSNVRNYMALRTGAQQPHINKEIVEDTVLICPTDDVLKKYYQQIEVIYAQLMNVSKESKLLISLRDFLLPMLMNGQVKVAKTAK